MEQVSEVGRSLIMEGFVCKEEDFELNALWNWEPVEVLEDGSDVITGAGVGEQTCSRIFGCTVAYLEFWMVCHRGCCCSSRFWR